MEVVVLEAVIQRVLFRIEFIIGRFLPYFVYFSYDLYPFYSIYWIGDSEGP